MKLLALSGGESKGDGQAGVAYQLHKVGWRWDYICGTSVGSMNGALIAQGDKGIERMREIWLNISNEQVYKGSLKARHIAWRRLRKKESILDTTPLEKMIEQEVDLANFDTSFEACHVDFESGTIHYTGTGEYAKPALSNKELRKAILASGTMPGIMPPVRFEGRTFVDGGLRDNTPLSRCIQIARRFASPEETPHITIITTAPLEVSHEYETEWMIEDQIARSFAIVYNELIRNDINQFITFNELAWQAKEMDRTLYYRGLPLIPFKYDLITPETGTAYGKDLMDFDFHEFQTGVNTATRYLAKRKTDRGINPSKQGIR